MQSTLFAAIATLTGLAAVGAAQDTTEYAYFEESNEQCAIVTEYEGDQMYLTAWAAEGTEGEYVLSLRQEGPGGSSSISQSGDFEPEFEGPTLLSEMSLPADGSYTASLQTYTFAGEFTCRAIV